MGRRKGKDSVFTLLVIFVFALSLKTCFSQNISRASFPKGFVFGTASSAFQVSSSHINNNKV